MVVILLFGGGNIIFLILEINKLNFRIFEVDGYKLEVIVL